MSNVGVLERPQPSAQAALHRRAAAADIGYGYVKVVSAAGMKACFPSAVAPAPDDLGLNTGPAFYRVRVRYLDGRTEEKLVGEAALRSAAAVTTLSREKPAEIHDLLLVTACALVGAGGTGPFPTQADVAVGLPLAYYKAQKDALRERLLGLAAWVSVDGGEERYVSFGRVLVLPQGAGAVAAYPELLPDSGLVGVVDVGTYTTDYLLLEKPPGQPNPRPLLEACGSVEAGAHLVHKAVAREFQAKTGAPLPPEMWEQAVQARAVFFAGRSVDLSAAVEKALADASQAVAQRVLAAWGNRAGFVRATLVVGGGSLLLREYLIRALPGAVAVPDPLFANALGFLRGLAG